MSTIARETQVAKSSARGRRCEWQRSSCWLYRAFILNAFALSLPYRWRDVFPMCQCSVRSRKCDCLRANIGVGALSRFFSRVFVDSIKFALYCAATGRNHLIVCVGTHPAFLHDLEFIISNSYFREQFQRFWSSESERRLFPITLKP